jgi:hypothetical protein
MYHESFKKTVLYEYFGSMRRTAAVLKISIASVSRWSKAKGRVAALTCRGRRSIAATSLPRLRWFVSEWFEGFTYHTVRDAVKGSAPGVAASCLSHEKHFEGCARQRSSGGKSRSHE